MAPRKKVACLEDLCLPVAYSLIENIITNHAKNKLTSEAQFIDYLKWVVKYVPPWRHDTIAQLHFSNIKKAFGDDGWGLNSTDEDSSSRDSGKSNSSEVSSCVNEEEVSLDVRMKVIPLLEIAKVELTDPPLPTYILNKLIELLNEMSHLETFAVYYDLGLNVELLNSKLPKAVASWTNLTTFMCQEYCTDKILALVCKNCALLEEVDVTHSNIHAKSIKSLVMCENLVTVSLDRNGLAPEDFLELLLESKSETLTEIHGLDEVLFEVLEELEQMRYNDSFMLKHVRIYTRENDEKYLKLLTKYFPFLTKIVLDRLFEERPAYQLHILSTLKYLKEVEISFQRTFSRTISTFLSTCSQVTAVSYDPKNDSDLSFFLNLVSQSCPTIKKLKVNNRSLKHLAPTFRFKEELQSVTQPFQNLTHLVWFSAPLTYVSYILRYAINIKNITFYKINFSEELFKYVLKYNPMNQLEKLYIDCANSLSPQMIKYIVVNCEKLTSLSLRNPPCSLDEFFLKNNYDIVIEKIEGNWVDRRDYLV